MKKNIFIAISTILAISGIVGISIHKACSLYENLSERVIYVGYVSSILSIMVLIISILGLLLLIELDKKNSFS